MHTTGMPRHLAEMRPLPRMIAVNMNDNAIPRRKSSWLAGSFWMAVVFAFGLGGFLAVVGLLAILAGA